MPDIDPGSRHMFLRGPAPGAGAPLHRHLLRRLAATVLALSLLAAARPSAPAAAAADPVGGGNDVFAPALRLAASDPGAAARAGDGRLRVWVWFADKGLSGPELSSALAGAAAGLSDRARIRRSRVRGSGGAGLVDATDLPLHGSYVEALERTGVRIRHRSRWLNAVSCDATARQLDSAAAIAGVERISLVRRSVRPDCSTRPDPARQAASADAPAEAHAFDYGNSRSELEQINVPAVHDLGITGQGVLIGMLDTGFETTHQALAGVDVIAAWDFVDGDPVVGIETGDPWDAHSHGTMTLSTIGGMRSGLLVGVAPGASFALAKTEDSAAELPVEEDNWVAGIEWLEGLGADVVSSSLGYRDWYDFGDLDGDTAASTIAADLAVAKGVVVVNSAGNERTNDWGRLLCPADGDSVIAAGAVDSTGQLASFSSPGPTADGRIKPDVSARGVRNYVASPYDDIGYLYVSGTSFSCPQTAGVAALLLSRMPGLDPLRVREALRATADRADVPDNDYGWGVIDALAALRHFGARFDHVPLPDTENTDDPCPVAAGVVSELGLQPGGVVLHHRRGGGQWQQTVMQAVAADSFAAEIPSAPAGTVVEYYLAAADALGDTCSWPEAAPAAVFSFAVGPDLTAPALSHDPLWDQPRALWPPAVAARAADNLGLAAVDVTFSVNGGGHDVFALEPVGDGLFSAEFPLEADWIAEGSRVEYTVRATDAAAAANTTESGPHAFSVIGRRGDVLLVDDTGGPGDCTLGDWLQRAGFAVRTILPADLAPGDFDDLHFVALSSGGNPDPVAVPAARYLLRQWVDGGGRLLAEGGEFGLAALTVTGYLDFARDTFHIWSWYQDDPGTMVPAAGMAGHPLLSDPHAVGDTLLFGPGAGSTDRDVVGADAGSYAVLVSSIFPDGGGTVIVHDAEGPRSGPQTVTLTFNLDTLADPAAGRKLVENGAAYLMSPAEPTSAPPPEGPLALLPNVPNPFNPRTEIRFRLPGPAEVDLRIYDSRGRLVARLLEGKQLRGGEHAVGWDGTDTRGRRAASGVYLVRVGAGTETDRAKLVLAR